MTNPLLGLGAPNGSIFDKPSAPNKPESKPHISVSGLGGVAKTVADIEHEKLTEVLELGTTALGDLPVDSIDDQSSYANRIVAAAKNFILPDAESFRAVLDALDQTMESQAELDVVSLDNCRNYVRAVMVTMQKDEAMAALILPKDARNAIRFARLQHQETQTMDNLKSAKAPAVKKPSSTKVIANMPKMDF
jgi:hypothetical protein